ncbi:hypothetical protein GCM10010245_24050 [Streptomyces spectabilis]|uniref:Uncharacterized protein n=1 Tax=Streptomyces spectabilis TaxID=68270 RepID=A0A7W8ETY5_STRST|nr:hypothetical protein [Streptomyces spectabilis]GGV13800.1 hypothetical protein GCM10010245_24050 [Streptomyces spectabilis]
MGQHHPGECSCPECRTRARLAAPTLYGFIGRRAGEPETAQQVFAWCPWCANWHRHGDRTNQPGDVLHRSPHCATGTPGPYEETGYLIAVTNIPLSEVWGQMRRSSDAQRLAIGDGRVTPAIERLRAQLLPILRPQHHGGRT